MRNWVDVATLAKTKNLQGGFVVESAANLSFLLQEGMEVIFVPPAIDAPRRAKVASISQAVKQSAVVLFDEVTNIDTAEALVGCHCLVQRDQVPPEAFLSTRSDWADWKAYDANAGLIGTILSIKEMPGQDLFEVSSVVDERIILIPLVDAFIIDVDEDAQRINFDVPAGLLDL